jgi:vacuolar protein sorting-associated protein 35
MDEDQDKFLDEAITVVKQQATVMQRSLDAGNLKDAIKHATSLISELRTSLLSPKHYYELYMTVFDELRYLELFFMEEYRKGKPMAELYEMVQHVGNVLPRLYLLITVGSVYIQTRELPAKDILKDLLEMVKGVQHPIRGLFLRYYLNKICKDKLPDKGNEYEGEGGDTQDSIEFITQNMSEMNRLWIRMQHTGHVKDKVKREKERSDLRVTVGENIIRLSNLEGIEMSVYVEQVLPKILEIVTSAKDTISQQYLMDCIIQAFSDDFHLNTLAPLLDACTLL